MASGESKGSRRYDKENLLWQSTVAIRSDPVGSREAVRRWREISKIQEILGAMTDEERKEFDAAIVQGDVELCTDGTGKTNSVPLDH